MSVISEQRLSFDSCALDILNSTGGGSTLRSVCKLILFGLILCVSGATNPAAAQTGRKPVRSLSEIRYHDVIIQKWETSCAAAALATVLTYSFDDPVSEKFVAQRMLRRTDPIKVKVRGGFSLLDMKHFVQSQGFNGIGLKGLTVQDLLILKSPIVPIDFYGNAHFVVVRGLNAKGQVHIADPAFGNHAEPVSEFKAQWKNGIAFVVTP